MGKGTKERAATTDQSNSDALKREIPEGKTLMSKHTTPRPIETRPAFVVANPHLKAAHLAAQRSMFASANSNGLSTRPEARDEMIDAVNQALGLRGSKRLVSRRQMTIDEMHAIAVAIDAGLFGDDWTWSEDFNITVRPVTMNVVHFEPRNSSHIAFRVPVYSTDEWDENGDA